MRAITVAVGYTDLLALTLPYNRHHFESLTVVTDPRHAEEVSGVCVPNRADVVVTDLFYRGGAVFNKWAALEYALDRIGRNGWLCLMDADVLWPKDWRVYEEGEFLYYCKGNLGPSLVQKRGELVTPRRRMCEIFGIKGDYQIPPQWDHATDGVMADVRPYPPECLWHDFPLHRQEVEFAGYTQIFHASDPVLGPPPWHQTDWKHAGGADSFFQAKWSQERKIRPPFEVLHLGSAGKNWCGRATPFADGTVPEGAAEKEQMVRSFIIRRRGRGMERHAHERLFGSGEK